MPQDQALQVFYGTIPLILVLTALYFRKQGLLKNILARLGRLEGELNAFRLDMKGGFGGVKERLVKLESRAGTVFHT